MGSMHEPRFLITGAHGYLGRALASVAAQRGSVTSCVHSSSLDDSDAVVMDIGDADAVSEVVASVEPTVIIHTAAVNPGQGDDAEMFRINTSGSHNVAQAAVAVDARLVAVSTDIVHDGTAGPYGDEAPATPINGYGRSKAEGEEAILGSDPTAVVVRTSLMYGLGEMDRGTRGFAERVIAGETVSLFSDVMRNPVRVGDLAEALVRLADSEYSGFLNVAGAQALSREEFGRRMLRYWGVASDGMIEAVRAQDISDSIPVDVRLDSSRAEELLGMRFPGVDEVLRAG